MIDVAGCFARAPMPAELDVVGRFEVGDELVEEVDHVRGGLVGESRSRLRDVIVAHDVSA